MILYVANNGEAVFTEASKKKKRKVTKVTLNDKNSPIDLLSNTDEDYPGEDDDTTAFMDDLADDGYPSDIMNLIGDGDLEDIPEGEDYPGEDDEYPSDEGEEEYPGDDSNEEEDTYPGEDKIPYPGDDNTDEYPGDSDVDDAYPGDNAYPSNDEVGNYPGEDTTDDMTGSDAYPGADGAAVDTYPGDTSQTDTGADYPAGNAPAPAAGDGYPGNTPDTTVPTTDNYPVATPDTPAATDAYPGDDTAATTTTPTTTDAYPGADTTTTQPATDVYPGDDTAATPTTTDGYPGDPNAGATTATPHMAPTGDAYPGATDQNADPNATPPIDPNAAPPLDNNDYTQGAADDMTGGDMDQAQPDQQEQQGPGIGYDSMRNFNLYKEYEKLLAAIDTYIEKINAITVDDIETNKLMKYCVNKLTETKDLCYDYMVIKFEACSYVQNRVFYQTLIVTIQLIFDTVEKIINSMKKNEK